MTTVAFDMNGTLLDTAAIAEPLGGTEADRALVARAFDATIEQALAATLAGLFPPFPALLAAALERELRLAGHGDESLEDAVARAAALPAFPEAGAALDRLAAAGVRLAVLSNSARESAEANLTQAGLRDHFDVVVGADEVQAYKPDRRVYERLLERLEEPADDVWLVAVHWWDLLGARQAGLRTGWVARRERHLIATAGLPNATGSDLLELADDLLARGARR